MLLPQPRRITQQVHIGHVRVERYTSHPAHRPTVHARGHAAAHKQHAQFPPARHSAAAAITITLAEMAT